MLLVAHAVRARPRAAASAAAESRERPFVVIFPPHSRVAQNAKSVTATLDGALPAL
jgi:hypothetical protein